MSCWLSGERARPAHARPLHKTARLIVSFVALHLPSSLRSDEKSKDKKTRVKWVTSAANRHLLKCPCKNEAATAAALRLIEAEARRSEKRGEMMHAAGCAASGSNVFVLDPRDKALCPQSRMYVYSRQRISKLSYENTYWMEAFQSAYEAGGGKGECPFVRRKGLIFWLTAEFETFLLYANFLLSMLLDQHEGNPPCQGVHDCATLKNKIKFMANGIAFTTPRACFIPHELPVLDAAPDAAPDAVPNAAAPAPAPNPSAKYEAQQPPPPKPTPTPYCHFAHEPPRVNMTLCLSMLPIADGTDATGAAQLKRECKRVTGFEYEDLCYATISDVAAIGVATAAHGEDGQKCKCVLARSFASRAPLRVSDLSFGPGSAVANAPPPPCAPVGRQDACRRQDCEGLDR